MKNAQKIMYSQNDNIAADQSLSEQQQARLQDIIEKVAGLRGVSTEYMESVVLLAAQKRHLQQITHRDYRQALDLLTAYLLAA